MSASLRDDVISYVIDAYGAGPERLWERFPEYVVFRRADNRKWFCLIMDLKYEKIDPGKSGPVDVLNVKLDDPLYRDLLVQQPGYYPGYHISRGLWISVALDGTVPMEDIRELIGLSYEVTGGAQRRNAALKEERIKKK